MKKAVIAVLTAALLSLVLLGMIAVVACTFSKETRTNNFSVGSSPAVDVEVGSGDVDLVVGAAGEIVVKTELKNPEKVDYEVSQDGDSVIVRANTRADGRADVTLTVPENTSFELSTGSGNVDVADMQASGQVNSGSGSITLEQIRGDIVGHTGSGAITLDDVVGSIVLNTGSGKIMLRDATGSFDLRTGSGAIAFQGELTPGGNNTFTTGSGSVTVELTGSPSVALDLETDDGRVKSELPVTLSETSRYRLVGVIGDGEAVLTIRVGSGDITIK